VLALGLFSEVLILDPFGFGNAGHKAISVKKEERGKRREESGNRNQERGNRK